jgi:hypothetical protein
MTVCLELCGDEVNGRLQMSDWVRVAQLRLAQRKVPDMSALSRSHARVWPSASESVRTLVSRIIRLLELAAADDGEAKNERPSPILYSCRNAIIGSTLLARRAGT